MEYEIKQSADDVIESIYKNRGINDDLIDSWLYANESNWESPENYPNIHKAYECLMRNIKEDKDIFIAQDSDLDGLFSCGILMNFIIKYLKYENVYYLIHEGKQHGITKQVLNKCLDDKIGLLICPDAGSSDFKHMNILLKNNIDYISLDHHNFDESKIPKGAIIVNNQYEQVKNKNGSGTLTTYKFIFYVAEQEGIDIGYDYLSECNIANISDMMELNGECLENRYIYNIGSDISNVKNKLVKSFIKDLGKKKIITIEDVSFGIAPKVNSIIRLGGENEKEMLIESAIGLTDEEIEYTYRGKSKTQSIYDAILRISNRLKSSQKRQIEKYISNGLDVMTKDDDRILIINGSDINGSLRGLLANKLMGTYKKPVLILSGENELKGSARGLGNINFNDLCSSSNLTMYTQGHDQSFGIGILKSNLEKFIEYINKQLLGVDFTTKTEVDYIYNDGYMPLDDVIDLGQIDAVWTFNCKRPKILIKNMQIDSSKIIKKGIDLSYKDSNGVLYKRDFCSKVFFEDLVCIDDNPDLDKIINVDMIVEVKTFESGISYVNIVEFESSINYNN